jgi:hypothetical protein
MARKCIGVAHVVCGVMNSTCAGKSSRKHHNDTEQQSTHLNLPLFDAPLSQQIMRPSYAVPPASFSQTASG